MENEVRRLEYVSIGLSGIEEDVIIIDDDGDANARHEHPEEAEQSNDQPREDLGIT